MGRHFTQGANDRITYLQPDGASTWQNYTVAVACRRTANFTGTTMNVVASRSNGFDRHNFHFDQFADTAAVVVTSPSFSFTSSTGLTYTTSDGWLIAAMTKTAGSTIPTFYKFVWSTGTWTTQAGAGAVSDGDEGGTPGWTISGYNNAEGFEGDIAAVAFWNRVMPLGELQRLPSGQWDRWRPEFLAEFPNGRDDPASARREVSRRHGATVSVVSGSSRAAITDPPGFRFSGLTRRR